MSDPTEHDAQTRAREPALGPESEVHRADAGGAPIERVAATRRR